MPLLTQDKAIKQYYEQVKDKYPDVTFEEFALVCKTPLQFVKRLIQSGTLPFIMVKHLGKFKVFPSRIKAQIASEKRFFDKGITGEEEYRTRTDFFTKYLKALNEQLNKSSEDDTEG